MNSGEKWKSEVYIPSKYRIGKKKNKKKKRKKKERKKTYGAGNRALMSILSFGGKGDAVGRLGLYLESG